MIQEQSADKVGQQDTGRSVPVELFGRTYPHKKMFKDDYGLRWDGARRSWSGKLTQDQAVALEQFCKEHKVGHRIGTGPIMPGPINRGLNAKILDVCSDDDGHVGPQYLRDFTTSEGCVRVVFKHIAEAIVAEIKEHEVIVGCSPWNSGPIWTALHLTPQVSLVASLGDEDKSQSARSFPPAFPHAASTVIRDALRIYWDMPAVAKSREFIPRVQAAPGSDVHHRLHSKFLVFCDSNGTPKKVVTGSLNFSNNAENCLENVVFIENDKIALAYAGEWYQNVIFALQERGVPIILSEFAWQDFGDDRQWEADYERSVRDSVPFGPDHDWLVNYHGG
ncbi:MAG: hypothetical protein ACLGJC_25360 [Alphaproteobacteria bacterium]